MRTYIIYTEDINREKVNEIVSRRFDGFTILFGVGFWKGQKENNLTIILLTDDEERIIEVVREIKKVNKQESVMVASFKTELEVI